MPRPLATGRLEVRFIRDPRGGSRRRRRRDGLDGPDARGVRAFRRRRPDPRLPGGGRWPSSRCSPAGGSCRESPAATTQDLLAVGIACATLVSHHPAGRNHPRRAGPRGLCPHRRLGGPHGFPDPRGAGPGRAHAGGAAARLPQPSRGHRALPRHVSSARRQDLPAVLPPLPEPHGRRLVDRRHPGGAAGQPAAQRGGDPRPVRRRGAAPRAPLGAGGRARSTPSPPRRSGRPSSRPPR